MVIASHGRRSPPLPKENIVRGPADYKLDPDEREPHRHTHDMYARSGLL